MPLTIQICEDFWDRSFVPLEVDTFQIAQQLESSIDEIKRLRIWQGKTEIEFGEAFQITGSLSDCTAIWQGDLSRVHWIGAKHSTGTMQIEGSVGRHLGSQMTGGSITVRGDAGDFAGVEMSGGTLRILGNSGNRVGARYPGSTYGMNRGVIFISGNAGHGVGENMRRGTILVEGDVGDLAGWNMLAGTILVGGALGKFTGAGMVRGSILCLGDEAADLLPTFTAGIEIEDPQWIRIFSRWLKDQNFDFPQSLFRTNYRLFSGDQLQGGRGEIWQAI